MAKIRRLCMYEQTAAAVLVHNLDLLNSKSFSISFQLHTNVSLAQSDQLDITVDTTIDTTIETSQIDTSIEYPSDGELSGALVIDEEKPVAVKAPSPKRKLIDSVSARGPYFAVHANT